MDKGTFHLTGLLRAPSQLALLFGHFCGLVTQGLLLLAASCHSLGANEHCGVPILCLLTAVWDRETCLGDKASTGLEQ